MATLVTTHLISRSCNSEGVAARCYNKTWQPVQGCEKSLLTTLTQGFKANPGLTLANAFSVLAIDYLLVRQQPQAQPSVLLTLEGQVHNSRAIRISDVAAAGHSIKEAAAPVCPATRHLEFIFRMRLQPGD